MPAVPPTPSSAVYRFEGFTLDLVRGSLLAVDGAEIALRPEGPRAAAPSRRAPGTADRPRRDHARGLARRLRHRRLHHPVREGGAPRPRRRGAAAAAHLAAARLPVGGGGVRVDTEATLVVLQPAAARRRPAGPDAPATPPRRRRPQAAHARGAALRQHDRRPGAGVLRRRHHRGPDHRALAPALVLGDRPQLGLHLQGPRGRRAPGRARARRGLRARGQRPQGGQPGADHRAALRGRNRAAGLGRALRRRPGRHLRPAGPRHRGGGRRHRAEPQAGRGGARADAADREPHRLRPLSARLCRSASPRARATTRRCACSAAPSPSTPASSPPRARWRACTPSASRKPGRRRATSPRRCAAPARWWRAAARTTRARWPGPGTRSPSSRGTTKPGSRRSTARWRSRPTRRWCCCSAAGAGSTSATGQPRSRTSSGRCG